MYSHIYTSIYYNQHFQLSKISSKFLVRVLGQDFESGRFYFANHINSKMNIKHEVLIIGRLYRRLERASYIAFRKFNKDLVDYEASHRGK
jgi:hypothetical protein